MNGKSIPTSWLTTDFTPTELMVTLWQRMQRGNTKSFEAVSTMVNMYFFAYFNLRHLLTSMCSLQNSKPMSPSTFFTFFLAFLRLLRLFTGSWNILPPENKFVTLLPSWMNNTHFVLFERFQRKYTWIIHESYISLWHHQCDRLNAP